ncbi:MAG TPA: LA2681 family HEPN domain-containing protein [Polyangiaceae bacterium]|nr:LA2681 family HEPN domain-containing protein [Polyangiaceae bacterium]
MPKEHVVEPEGALHRIGLLIDAATDNRDAGGLRDALDCAAILREQALLPSQAALLWYFVGNAWAGLRFLRAVEPQGAWDWEQPEVREEVIAFRRAAGHEGYPALHRVRRCQIPTNLANLFSTTGRFIDAIEWFDRALAENARFGMALGNKGMCLANYAKSLYDAGHRLVFAGIARGLLEQAIALPLEREETRSGFRAAIEPDATATALLRNRLEHQYVKVTERPRVQPVPTPEEPPPDPIAYRIERSHLEAKALRMMKMTRSALIYLSLTLHKEERKNGPDEDGAVLRGQLPILG